MDALCSADLCSELLELVLGASYVDLSDELAVKVVKSDLDGTSVKESRCGYCE